jgi:hypothetical protein
MSPQQLLNDAKETILGGHSTDDMTERQLKAVQIMLMWYCAQRVEPTLADLVCKLMLSIYPKEFCLLSERDVTDIAKSVSDG